MRGAVLYGPRDIRFEERATPTIRESTDAVIRISATCVCGSDLWPYRGVNPITQPTPMGHEYCGVVEEVGRDVTRVRPGQFVIGSFFASDNTCPNCHAGYQSSCQHKQFVGDAQAPLLRVPLADGTLVPTREVPSEDMIPSLLTLSDVMGTGWFAADAAGVKPGATVVVVGDGRRRTPWCPLGQPHGCRAHHRNEPPRVAPEACPRVRCDRDRSRAWGKSGGPNQRPDQRNRC